ncbi:MAG TPA: PKD domain-containing protein, partial [Cytophagaceae bacterium]
QNMLLTIAGKSCVTAPMVDLGADSLYLCGLSDSKIIDAANPGMTYLWSPSAGNATTQTVTVNTEGVYYVKVTNNKGCSGYDTVKVGVANVPVAAFTHNLVTCQGDSSYFTNLSEPSSGLSYLWDFDATGNSLEVHPVVKFSDAGEYLVTLVVTSDKGCKDTLAKPVNVFPLPVASFTAKDTCNGNALNLIDNSTITGGFPFVSVVAQTSWDFGDDTFHNWNAATDLLSERNPSLKSYDAGSYVIKLIATSNAGCKDTLEQYFTITPSGPSDCISPVVLNLGEDTYVCGDNYSITLNAGNSGAKYEWGSSNGFTSNAQIVTVSDTGYYWVKVDKGGGVVGADTIHIAKSDAIVAGIYLASSIINVGDTVQFIQLSEPDPINFYWNFGDGVYSTEENPTHIYYLPADYTVTMIVDNGFCADTVTKLVNVRELKKDIEEEYPDLFTEILYLNIYPNPTGGKFIIKLELESDADVKFQITDLLGKVFFEKQVVGDKVEETSDLSNLKAGVYILKVSAGSETRMIRFLKI